MKSASAPWPVAPLRTSSQPASQSVCPSAGEAVDMEACFSQLTLDVIGKVRGGETGWGWCVSERPAPAAAARAEPASPPVCFTSCPCPVRASQAVFNYDFDALNKNTPVIQVGWYRSRYRRQAHLASAACYCGALPPQPSLRCHPLPHPPPNHCTPPRPCTRRSRRLRRAPQTCCRTGSCRWWACLCRASARLPLP